MTAREKRQQVLNAAAYAVKKLRDAEKINDKASQEVYLFLRNKYVRWRSK